MSRTKPDNYCFIGRISRGEEDEDLNFLIGTVSVSHMNGKLICQSDFDQSINLKIKTSPLMET